jgi:hypothetical protein
MRVSLILPLLLLAGCRNEEPIPVPTAGERRQLDQAEAELNALGNDEGPTSGDADPSGNSV